MRLDRWRRGRGQWRWWGRRADERCRSCREGWFGYWRWWRWRARHVSQRRRTLQGRPRCGCVRGVFFSQTAGDEPLLVPFIPSVALRLRLCSSGGASSDASTVISQAVVREELILIEVCSRRTHSAAFRNWCVANSARVAGIRIAVADLQTQLLGLVSEGGGEGACVF